MNFRLQTKFILGIVGLTVLLSIGLSIVFFLQGNTFVSKMRNANAAAVEEMFRHKVVRESTELAYLLSNMLVNSVYRIDMAGIANYLQSVVDQGDVISIYVFDKDDKVLHDGTDALRDYGKAMWEVFNPPIGFDLNKQGVWQVGNIQYAYSPIFIGSRRIGGVGLGQSLEGFEGELASFQADLEKISDRNQQAHILATGGSILILSFVGVFLAMAVAGRLVSPINSLVAMARQIGRGETNVQSPIQRSDEIGELGDALMDMSSQLDERTDELHDTMKRLEETVHKLSHSNTDLERFAYIASHDLQEPLRSVVSYSQLLEKKYKNKLDDDADEYLKYIVSGGKHMSALIKDLLTYSRVQAAKHDPKSVDCNRIMRVVLSNLRDQVAKCDAQIIYETLPDVMGVELQLTQLFQNLVGNAIKFVPSGTKPVVKLECQREANGMWTFSVKDNGIGIDPHHSEKIFALFTRLHRTEDYPGTGLGLGICQRVVEKHGGNIWVKSMPGEGAAFFFTLPERPDEDRVEDRIEDA